MFSFQRRHFLKKLLLGVGTLQFDSLIGSDCRSLFSFANEINETSKEDQKKRSFPGRI